MPSTVNGIGTHYYGQKNLREYQGLCHSCKHYIHLKSYDTGLYFVFVFIPLVPLGKKRIIDFCARCNRHRALPLKDHAHVQNLAAAAHAQLISKPCETTAAQALKAAIHAWDQPLVYDVCQTIEATLPTDDESLRLAAGYYSEFLYKHADAERALRAALAVKDQPATRELLAQSLLIQEKPMEAEPYLRHIVEEGISNRVGIIYWLAQTFQTQGEHIMALAYFEHCLALSPAMADNKEFKLLKATSEKNLHSQIKVAPVKVIQAANSSARKKVYALIAAVVIATLLLFYVIYAIYLGGNHPVYLVNGLNQPSIFLLNGQTHTLKPHEIAQTSVAEGNVTVEMVDPKPIDPPQTTLMESSFFMRPLGWTTFIINPDRTAIISRTTYHYAPQNAQAPTYTLQSGNTLLTFESTDYGFDAPPNTIETSDNSSSGIKKTALERWESQIQSENDLVVLITAKKYLDKNTLVQLARRRLFLSPDSTATLAYLHASQSPDEFTQTIAPLLDIRPVNVQLHRTYQDAMDSLDNEPRLQATYNDYLKKEPDNNDLIYLHLRIQRDRAKAKEAILAQIKTGKAPFYSHSLLAYIYAGDANLPAAGESAQSALRSQNEKIARLNFTQAALPLFIGAGKLDQANAAIEPLLSEPATLSVPACAIAVQIAMAKGDMKQANQLLADLDAKVGRVENIDRSTARDVRNDNITYAQGDIAAYAHELESKSTRDDKFHRFIALDQLQDAHKLLFDQPDEATPEECLIVYIAGMHSSYKKLAQDALDLAISNLEGRGYTERLWAGALSGKQSPAFDKLRAAPGAIANWPIYLTALGLARPEYQSDAFALARILLVLRTFPYHTLAPVLGIPSPARAKS